MKEIISSLDIGSSTIKLVVGEVYNNEVNVLSVSEVKSKGVKKGIIVNPEETLVSLKEAFNRTEEMLNIKINKVVLLVPSYYAEFIITEGSTNVRNEEGIIDGILTTNLIYQTPNLLSKPYYINCDMSKYIALIIDTLNHDGSLSEILSPNERIQNVLQKYKNGETI